MVMCTDVRFKKLIEFDYQKIAIIDERKQAQFVPRDNRWTTNYNYNTFKKKNKNLKLKSENTSNDATPPHSINSRISFTLHFRKKKIN